jgi:hypothetical protein
MVEIARESPVRKADQGKKRGRKPKMPLMKEIELAYGHLHNLDWLQESSLANLPSVHERTHRHNFMPEAQALRELLIEAAQQVIQDITKIPGMESETAFLKGYLAGKKVSEIAKELGVTREWCSRGYRKEAFRLAGMQFVRLVSFRE